VLRLLLEARVKWNSASPFIVGEKSGVSWDEIVKSFHSGITRAKAKYKDLQVALLCIASRDYGADSVDETASIS